MGKPMFNAVLVSSLKKTKEGHVELSVPQIWAIQKVVAIGPHTTSVSVGDVVHLNISTLERNAVPFKIGNKEGLLITERDILWIYDESEYETLINKELLETV
jgi:hypothetical protein